MNVSPALVISLPLASAAILVALLDRIPRRVTEWLAIAIGTLTLASTVAILFGVMRYGTDVVWIGGWHPGNRVGLGIVLAVDLASASVGVLIAVTVLAAILFSYQYFEDVGTIFYVLILAMLGAMIAFAYAGDLFNMFVWYEVFSVAAYALATFHGESKTAFQGALQFALTNTVAGLFFLVGIVLVEGRTGELDLVAIGHSLASHGHADPIVTSSLALIAIGLFTRGALAPMQFWFDEVHATAPAPLNGILSGAMAPLALYGFARIYWTMYATALPPSHVLVAAIVAIGALSACYGTVMTLRESRLRHKLAQATVAHSGVALAAIGGLGIRGLAGAAAYEASFASAAVALFFAIAILDRATGEHDAMLLRGAGRSLPLTGVAFAFATLVMGAVWTSIRAVADTGAPRSSLAVALLAALVAAGTGGAFLAVFIRVFVMRPRGVRVRAEGSVPWFLIAPTVGMALFATAIAVVPGGLGLVLHCASLLASHGTYARAVIDGILVNPARVATPQAPAFAWLGPLGACAFAASILIRARSVRRLRIVLMKNVAYRLFQSLDRGDSGAYIAWIAGSAATLTYVFSLALP